MTHKCEAEIENPPLVTRGISFGQAIIRDDDPGRRSSVRLP